MSHSCNLVLHDGHSPRQVARPCPGDEPSARRRCRQVLQFLVELSNDVYFLTVAEGRRRVNGAPQCGRSSGSGVAGRQSRRILSSRRRLSAARGVRGVRNTASSSTGDSSNPERTQAQWGSSKNRRRNSSSVRSLPRICSTARWLMAAAPPVVGRAYAPTRRNTSRSRESSLQPAQTPCPTTTR